LAKRYPLSAYNMTKNKRKKNQHGLQNKGGDRDPKQLKELKKRRMEDGGNA